MRYEGAPRKENIADPGKRMRDLEFEIGQERIEQAEKNVELWQVNFDKVWDDKQTIEAQEGPLVSEDTRMTAIKICAMRLDEAKTTLRELKQAKEEMVKKAGLN